MRYRFWKGYGFNNMMASIGLSALFSVLIGWLAYRRGSLSASGMWGAVIVGTCIFGLGGWRWGMLLTLFFVSSSGLSHFREAEKAAVAEEKFAKGHARDWGQVMANGGLGSLLAVGSVVWPAWFWWPLFVGVMATVNADTWATELGTLAQKRPRLITNGRDVPPGTSGGVTVWGTAATMMGGLVIGLTAALVSAETNWVIGLLMGGIGGFVGSLCDSLLGATWQAMYYDETAQIETEKTVYQGRPTRQVRGFSWMSNDVVNLLASLVGGGVASLLWYYLF